MLQIDNEFTELQWLLPLRQDLERLLKTGRCPHALLVHGSAGTGRRHLALWFAAAMLEAKDLRSLASESAVASHPDLLIVEPPEGKAVIRVDQIREVVDFFQLTSHSGRGRLAIIWPAESMNASSANALLKTLEEPPAGSVLMLISDSLGRLPATVVSRCQRLRVPIPPRELALQWLENRAEAGNLASLLDFAGGAPLAALRIAAEFGELDGNCSRDLENLQQRRANPVEVAARWAKHPDFALEWLNWRVACELRSAMTVRSPGSSLAVAPADQADNVAACFRQLGQIRELRRVFKGGISTELSLAGLLMRWYGGLGS